MSRVGLVAGRVLARPCRPSVRICRPAWSGEQGGPARFHDFSREQTTTYQGVTPPSALGVPEDRSRRWRSILRDLSPASRKIETGIINGEIEVVQHLKEAIRTGTVTLEMVRICVQAEYARLERLKRKERVQAVRAEGKNLARTIMEYLWQDEQRWGPLVRHDVDTAVKLCYFAVSEGLESYVIAWLNVAVTQPSGPSQPESSNEPLWRGMLLVALTKAHMMRDCDHRLDEALQCFFRALQNHNALLADAPPNGSASIEKIIVRPALTAIGREILTGRWQQTNAGLYDKFVKFNASVPARVDCKQADDFSSAGMHLFHPTRPQYRAALACFDVHVRQAVSDSDLKQVRIGIGMSNSALKSFVSRACELAKLAHRPADAAVIKYQGARLLAISLPGIIAKDFVDSQDTNIPGTPRPTPRHCSTDHSATPCPT